MSAATGLSCWVGIDPGLDGAIAVLWEDGSVSRWPMPTLGGSGSKRSYDFAKIVGILRMTRPSIKLALVEEQQAFGKQGAASSFKTGLGYGALLGCLMACEIPHEVVKPGSWKRDMGLPAPTVKPKKLPAGASAAAKKKAASALKNAKTAERKRISLEAARRLFPRLELLPSPRHSKPSDGIAEAALLAKLAERRWRGSS